MQYLMAGVTDEDREKANAFIADNFGKPHNQPALLAWAISMERRIAALEDSGKPRAEG